MREGRAQIACDKVFQGDKDDRISIILFPHFRKQQRVPYLGNTAGCWLGCDGPGGRESIQRVSTQPFPPSAEGIDARESALYTGRLLHLSLTRCNVTGRTRDESRALIAYWRDVRGRGRVGEGRSRDMRLKAR